MQPPPLPGPVVAKSPAKRVAPPPLPTAAVGVKSPAPNTQRDAAPAQAPPASAALASATSSTDWAKKRRLAEIEDFLLSQVPLLKKMKPFERKRLAPFMTVVEYRPGEHVMVEDDEADAMFFLKGGGASVSIRAKGVVNQVQPGEYFGELALLTGHPRAATVTAGPGGAMCYRLNQEHFGDVPKYIRLNFMRHAAEAYVGAMSAETNPGATQPRARSRRQLLRYIESTIYKQGSARTGAVLSDSESDDDGSGAGGTAPAQNCLIRSILRPVGL